MDFEKIFTMLKTMIILTIISGIALTILGIYISMRKEKIQKRQLEELKKQNEILKNKEQ